MDVRLKAGHDRREEGMFGVATPQPIAITEGSSMDSARLTEIGKILDTARKAAIRYYEMTGKPLGITGEVGEYEAAKRLGLELADARTPGYDAKDRKGRRLQIKARRLLKGKKLGGQRLGSIDLKHKWEAVLLVLLDEYYSPTAMYLVNRRKIEHALSRTNSRARKRGALAISEFKQLGIKAWPK
jgi:hypothetical protein